MNNNNNNKKDNQEEDENNNLRRYKKRRKRMMMKRQQKKKMNNAQKTRVGMDDAENNEDDDEEGISVRKKNLHHQTRNNNNNQNDDASYFDDEEDEEFDDDDDDFFGSDDDEEDDEDDEDEEDIEDAIADAEETLIAHQDQNNNRLALSERRRIKERERQEKREEKKKRREALLKTKSKPFSQIENFLVEEALFDSNLENCSEYVIDADFGFVFGSFAESSLYQDCLAAGGYSSPGSPFSDVVVDENRKCIGSYEEFSEHTGTGTLPGSRMKRLQLSPLDTVGTVIATIEKSERRPVGRILEFSGEYGISPLERLADVFLLTDDQKHRIVRFLVEFGNDERDDVFSPVALAATWAV